MSVQEESWNPFLIKRALKSTVKRLAIHNKSGPLFQEIEKCFCKNAVRQSAIATKWTATITRFSTSLRRMADRYPSNPTSVESHWEVCCHKLLGWEKATDWRWLSKAVSRLFASSSPLAVSPVPPRWPRLQRCQSCDSRPCEGVAYSDA